MISVYICTALKCEVSSKFAKTYIKNELRPFLQVAQGGKATPAPHTHSSPLEMLQRLEILCPCSPRLSKWSTLSSRNLWVVEEVEEEGDGEMEDEEEVEDVGVEDGEHSPPNIFKPSFSV